MINKKKKIAVVAISGGLDSSTVARMLVKRGYEVIGVFMCLGIGSKCCDLARARMVCNKIGARFYPIDLSNQFQKEVKDYFLNSYKKGITPNPCAVCNKFLKFGELLKVARRLKAEFLATGHYVKLKKDEDVYRIFRPQDKKKDQTYFLYTLTQDQLKDIRFPLGDRIKENIRKEAESKKLPYIKKESQDVCFLPADHNVYLRENLKLKEGDIRNMGGEVIGQHQGLPLYTVGQRKGIEIGGKGPYYAVKMDYKTNTLYVVSDRNAPELYREDLVACEVNWIAGSEPRMPLICDAVIRYGHKQVLSTVKKKGRDYLVEFAQSQRAVTPGQNIVFYIGDEMVGGGTISDKR